MEKNTAEAKTKKITIDTKYESLENKINELLNSINTRKIKTVSKVFYQELLDFLNSNNIIIIKKEDDNYYMKNGERGKKLIPLSESMVQRLKLLGYYTEQDYEERDIVNSIVDDMQKMLNEEETISNKYEILELNNFSKNPNEISVTLIDNYGNKIENIILPIVLTKYMNQNSENTSKIELQILFSLQKRLDDVLNKLLKDIENEYKDNQENMSFRERFIKEDISQKEIIDDVLNLLKEQREELEQEIKNYKLIREDDGIYLKCQNNSIKLPDSIVMKLQLLGYYDERESALVEEVMNKILDILTISEFYHNKEYLTPEDCYISKISTIGDLSSDTENGEKINILDGIAVSINQIKKEKMFKDKNEKDRKETEAILPYKFVKMITQNNKDAFSTEMEILRTINELFLRDTQISEVNSKEINKILNTRGIILEKKIIDGKIQFVAKKDNQEILIDKKISQNILKYMKSEIISIARSKYINNEEFFEEEPQSEEESSEDIKERKHEEYLLKTYKLLEKLNDRGYIAKGISTGITEKNKIYGRNPIPNKIVLTLPYGIEEDLPEINEVFNKIVKTGQYVDPSELLVMIECIKNNEEHDSNFEKYKKILINTKRMVKGKQSIINGLNNIIGIFSNKRKTKKYTMSSQQEPPTRVIEGLIPELSSNNIQQEDENGEIIVEVVDNNNSPITTTYAKFNEINE